MDPTTVGIAIGIPIGLFLAVVLYAWLDEREDAYANIEIKKEIPTSIEWSLRMHSIPPKYPIRPKARRIGGHLGHYDHKARERYSKWIENIQHPRTK